MNNLLELVLLFFSFLYASLQKSWIAIFCVFKLPEASSFEGNLQHVHLFQLVSCKISPMQQMQLCGTVLDKKQACTPPPPKKKNPKKALLEIHSNNYTFSPISRPNLETESAEFVHFRGLTYVVLTLEYFQALKCLRGDQNKPCHL